jgi:hypothetical protein
MAVAVNAFFAFDLIRIENAFLDAHTHRASPVGGGSVRDRHFIHVERKLEFILYSVKSMYRCLPCSELKVVPYDCCFSACCSCACLVRDLSSGSFLLDK